MSAESVSAPATQAPKQAPKQFSELEELGFILSNFIKSRYPLQDGASFTTIHDNVTGVDFDIKRKGNKIYVSKHKNQRRPKQTQQKPPNQSE